MADSHHQVTWLCLVGAMDRLWFHHAVIFPEPIQFLSPNSPQLTSDSSKSSLSDAEDIPPVVVQAQVAISVRSFSPRCFSQNKVKFGRCSSQISSSRLSERRSHRDGSHRDCTCADALSSLNALLLPSSFFHFIPNDFIPNAFIRTTTYYIYMSIQIHLSEIVTIHIQEAEIEPMKITPTEDEKGNIKTRTSEKVRSKSHSPKRERQQQSKTMIITKDITTPSSKRLEKTTSSKTYEDLEQEEVKGFIDLGFRFKKEHISPRMMTVVPGLQKIITTGPLKVVTMSEMECVDKNESGATVRPYLSEAWLIKRPDSPLLNMRVRRGYAAADMKKQLKSWARIVATETIQES